MPQQSRFFEQFIEDFFAECDEHLMNARRVLLGIEALGGETRAEPRALHELFRSLHTLKGLCGMVGLAGAERVAHALEGTLRGHQRATSPLDRGLVDAFFTGVDLLERCVAARRAGAEAPEVDPFLAELARHAPRGAAATDATEDGAAAGALPPATPVPALDASQAPPGDAVVHHFEFVPSRPLADRGVGVELVRARLQALGTLLDVRPRVVEGGVSFDFRVAIPPGAAPDPAWRDEGLSWTVPAGSRDANGDGSAAGVAHPPGSGADAPAAPAIPGGGAGVLRVDLSRLDEVVRLVGELVNSRGRLEELIRSGYTGDDSRFRDALQEVNGAMERQLRNLREGVMRIRLVPVGEVFERLRFAVRDVAREAGRRVTMELRGQETAIDKLVVDRMLEPLLHLVRNAVSHGIEDEEERRTLGKPAVGRLTLSAAAAGDQIVIQIADDGRGVDVEAVAARARHRGLLAPDQPLDAAVLLDLLSTPGFSTRDEPDMTSGRGVGMDVVRSTVNGLGGELELHTTAGRGTTFTISLPLTLMIVDALLVEVGGQQLAVPQPVLREILRVEEEAVTEFENNAVTPYRGGVLPLVSLRRLFDLPAARRDVLYLLVVGSDAAPTGLVVDRLVGLREIVVHPVTDPLVAVPGVAGATETGDGRVSLVLDTAALVRLALESSGRPRTRR